MKNLTASERELLTTVFTDLLEYDGGEMQSMRETVACMRQNYNIKEYALKYGIDLSDIDTYKL